MLGNFSGADFYGLYLSSEFKKKNGKLLSCVDVFHKTRNRETTAKKCTKTRDKSAKQKQKRVFRIISKSTFDAHSDPILKDLKLKID